MQLYDRALEGLARSRIGGWLVLNVMTYLDRKLMKWSRGRLSSSKGTHLQKNMLLLTTIGRKSGKERNTPLLYVGSRERFALIASRAGHPNNPAWYYNLKTEPKCRVQLEGEELQCVAHEAQGEERELWWDRACALYPGYNDYASRTPRHIPVLVLTPSSSVRDSS